MFLAVDIGNSNVVVGIYEPTQGWRKPWRMQTTADKTAAMFEMEVRQFFLEDNLKLGQIEATMLSSVVPALTPIWREVLARLFGFEPLVMSPALYPQLNIGIRNTEEIGSDLVANAVAAFHRVNGAAIIVDFGTALTLTTLDASGDLIGVAIAPGLKTAIQALYKNTALLPEVPLVLPSSAIGRNTTEAIQVGVLMGYVGLVKHLIAAIQAELGQPCKVLATGGLSAVLGAVEAMFDEVDIHLTLDGLRLIHQQVTR
ncbi:MAG TPA: type III pantothenate kinase [Microscillaceae bacterium]|nr:type III pantothenate kinase [Microscillaceae bacterium]